MMTTEASLRRNPSYGSKRITRQIPSTFVSTSWIILWVIGSVLPILPYAQPLWQYALADTPYAYLLWIPVFAFLWAVWSLTHMTSYNDDAELNGITGLVLIVFSGAILIKGMHSWAGAFIGNSNGLLIWPIWAMGLAWMVFGVGVTGRLLRPLAYLMLAWPPLYSTIVNMTNPILDNLANDVLHLFTGGSSWLISQATFGDYLIQHAGQWIPVQVSAVCSGSDSFLAMSILLPIILVIFEGTVLKKMILIVVASILSLLMNLMRLFILIGSAHWFGDQFTFGILHPVLGIILFIVSIGILSLIGRFIKLTSKKFQTNQSLRTPGRVRSGLVILFTSVLTLVLWPIYGWASGSFGSPLPVATNNLSRLMPSVPGYVRNLLLTYNETAVLGPGSYCRAFAYSDPKSGYYAMAEEWWTYNLSALQSYGVNNCLLFHGYSVLATQNFNVSKGVSAEAFAILLPASIPGGPRNAFEDISYTYSVKYHGRNAYIRAEFMTPIRYQVKSGDPILSVIPKVLSEQYSTPSSTSAIHLLQPTEVQNLQAFKNFIRTFSSRGLNPKLTANVNASNA